jgi:hypothetical protein
LTDTGPKGFLDVWSKYVRIQRYEVPNLRIIQPNFAKESYNWVDPVGFDGSMVLVSRDLERPVTGEAEGGDEIMCYKRHVGLLMLGLIWKRAAEAKRWEGVEAMKRKDGRGGCISEARKSIQDSGCCVPSDSEWERLSGYRPTATHERRRELRRKMRFLVLENLAGYFRILDEAVGAGSLRLSILWVYSFYFIF